MKHRLYELIIPHAIRTRIYTAFCKDFMLEAREGESRYKSAIPHVELSARHIENLRVLTNREAMLQVMPSGSTVAEIGVWRGDFSTWILSVAMPQKLHLIDPWDLLDPGDKENVDFVKDRFKDEMASGKVVIHCGFSYDELERFSDRYFDWVYLDADHTYQTTAKELAICRTKVKDGGLIAGHDYITGDWSAHFRYGVVEAVNEFCEKYDWEMIYLTNEAHRHISFALRRCVCS